MDKAGGERKTTASTNGQNLPIRMKSGSLRRLIFRSDGTREKAAYNSVIMIPQ
jgi:hypothetical protein